MTAQSSRPSAPAGSPSEAALSKSLEQSLQAAREALERLRITLGSPPLRRQPSARPTEAGDDAAVLSEV
ncbi:MAG TPA: hypothetical protein VFB81_05850 [Myxococcales bacterium]|nr:hypothetical protein [Myxococcales bacterium]